MPDNESELLLRVSSRICPPGAASPVCAPTPTGPRLTAKPSVFNRALANEFLYARRFRSENERRIRLKRWIHDYNCHRHHTAIGGPPASRANNLTRTDN